MLFSGWSCGICAVQGLICALSRPVSGARKTKGCCLVKMNRPILQMSLFWRRMQRAALVFAVLLLLIGILRGEARMVLQRAIQICLGCIGIG